MSELEMLLVDFDEISNISEIGLITQITDYFVLSGSVSGIYSGFVLRNVRSQKVTAGF